MFWRKVPVTMAISTTFYMLLITAAAGSNVVGSHKAKLPFSCVCACGRNYSEMFIVTGKDINYCAWWRVYGTLNGLVCVAAE